MFFLLFWLLLSHPAKFKSGRRFAQIFADKSKKPAFISVYQRSSAS